MEDQVWMDRATVSLNDLIAIRRAKVEKLINGEPDVLECGDPQHIEYMKAKIAEYTSVLKYLEDLKAVIENC